MAESLAQQLNPEVVQTRETVVPSKITMPKRVSWSWSERLLCVSGAMVTLILMVTLVSLNVTTTNYQRHLQDDLNKIATLKSQNGDLKQAVGELSDTTRLTSFAKANGLTFHVNNVRIIKK